MTRPAAHDILFDPPQIGPVKPPNRFYATPHCIGTRDPQVHAAFRGRRAAGGWGVVCTGYCSIHPEADDSPYQQVRIWNDAHVRDLASMTAAVHEHGSLAGIELWYGGLVGAPSPVPGRGVSAMPSDQSPGRSVYEMTKAELRELRGFYTAAARRARTAGFDIILIGAQEADNIVDQFLMSAYNHRGDEYGGPLENRARFLLEVLEDVRAVTDGRAALGVRLCIDTLDGTSQGIRAEIEGRAIIAMINPHVDLVDGQVGGWLSARWGTDPEPGAVENSRARYIRAVRDATSKPLVAVGRFTNPDTMAEVIRSDQQDLIGAARAAIADPDLPAKIAAGEAWGINACTAGNHCVTRISEAQPVRCTRNPSAGREYLDMEGAPS